MISHNLVFREDHPPGLQSLEIRDLRPLFLENLEDSPIYAQTLVSLGCKDHLAFMAPSGRGKTTFLRALSGLPVEGSGTLAYQAGGGALQSIPNARTKLPGDPAAFVRACFISVIPQDFKLIPHATVMTNLRLAQSAWSAFQSGTSRNRGLPTDEEIHEMARILELETRLDRKVSTLSRGEQQRVAILRALTRPFDLLIADEPFSHLDGKRDEKALELLISTAAKYHAGLWILDLGFIPGLEALKARKPGSVPGFKEYHL